MTEELIVIGKVILAVILYIIAVQTAITLHDYLIIRKIRREAKSEN